MCAPFVILDDGLLLTWAVLDHLVYLLLHCIKVEGRRVLHRWIVDCRLRQLGDVLLDHDEAPELTGEEVVAITPGAGVGRLAPKTRRALERILANVDQRGHVSGGLLARPAPRLGIERELEVVEANCAELRAAEIEQLTALGCTFAGEEIHLIVTVQMILVGALAELHALEQLLGDVRVPCRGYERGEPIEAGKDSVLDGARLDLPWPADNGGDAEAALADGTLGVLERRHAAVRPSEHLGAVVRREDHDRIVGLADLVEMLEQGADAVIELRHAGFLETVVRLAVLHCAVLLRQERPDVHARGVVPDEERLAVSLGAVHEIT